MLHSRAIGIIVNTSFLVVKLEMNGLGEALYGQLPTRKLVFMIIPIARECSINFIFIYLNCIYNFHSLHCDAYLSIMQKRNGKVFSFILSVTNFHLVN